MNQATISFPRRVRSFIRSLLSRAFGYSRRVDSDAKTIRKLSCNGHEDMLGPCEHREKSQHTDGAFFCGACGCGDRPAVFVGGNTPRGYEKLDYPYVFCPAKMPGFSNYEPAGVRSANDSEQVLERIRYLEQLAGVESLNEMAEKQRKQYGLLRLRERVMSVYGSARRIFGSTDQGTDASN